MPYASPTLTQLIAQTAADVRAALPTADPLLRRAVLTVLSRVLAGQHHEQFGYLDWIARQAVPFTATGENLAGWAALRGLAALPATYGSVTALSSSNNPHTAVAPGASLLRSDGTSYTASGGGAVDANGNITLAVSAVTAGSASNVANGAGLVLSSPASGVNSNFAVTAIIANGTDLETDDSLRSRLLAAFANPVQGGDLADYVQWASAVGGVTRLGRQLARRHRNGDGLFHDGQCAQLSIRAAGRAERRQWGARRHIAAQRYRGRDRRGA
jgi:uncharacterized phage protein gp47/JayE